MALHLRFTHSHDEDEKIHQKYLDKLVAWIKSMSPASVIISLEPADNEVANTHTHTAIKINMDKVRFKERFSKIFPDCKGNKWFAVYDDIKDFEELEAYVCKGRDDKYSSVNPTIVYTNQSDEYIKECHSRYWQKNKELKSKPKKTKKTINWSKQCLEEYKKEYPNRTVKGFEGLYHVYGFVLDKLGKDVKAFDAIVIKRLCLGVYNALLPEGSRGEFRQDLFKQSFPDVWEELTSIPGFFDC